jgi:hypothetical protein
MLTLNAVNVAANASRRLLGKPGGIMKKFVITTLVIIGLFLASTTLSGWLQHNTEKNQIIYQLMKEDGW